MNTRSASFHGRDGLRAVRLIADLSKRENGTARRPSSVNFTRFLAGKSVHIAPKRGAPCLRPYSCWSLTLVTIWVSVDPRHGKGSLVERNPRTRTSSRTISCRLRGITRISRTCPYLLMTRCTNALEEECPTFLPSAPSLLTTRLASFA